MSDIVLLSRAAAQVIQANFFNDMKRAFCGDVMGRDSDGNPASGQNCGTPAFPWGAGYFEELIVGGIAFNTASLERPPYQIISGKTRSGSNQSAFLVPAGSSPSFNLLASSVNLVLSINGVACTWEADVNSIPITAAPSTTNTCLVNDATAAAQAATKTWGEYGSGSPYYAITVDAMGANMSARVGSFQAFKVGTEYFLGYIESATSISRCFRGFFFDSSMAPLKRVALTDNDTITLMNLGYVFADQDGSTVDTIFVGAGVNNTPSYTYTAPSSPATGDYWFDMGNQVWKTWGGAAWAITNRILVGLVVADSTNCKAARSFDFFGLCRPDNTVDIAYYSSTAVKGIGLFSRVNVNGELVNFGTTIPVWTTASNLAASSDRYNAAVTASKTEYFYVADTGETKISDIEPYWRADLLGWYHPHNPWRCVGQNLPDGSANFQSSTTLPIRYKDRGAHFANATKVSSSSGATVNVASSTPVDVTGTITIQSNGSPIKLSIQPDGTGASFFESSAAGSTGSIILLQGSTIIAEIGIGELGSFIPSGLEKTYYPACAGAYTFKVQIRRDSGAGTISAHRVVLVGKEEA